MKTPLSELRRLMSAAHEITTHGFRSFRSMPSTIMNEQEWQRGAIKRQLAHESRESIRAAFNSAAHLSLTQDLDALGLDDDPLEEAAQTKAKREYAREYARECAITHSGNVAAEWDTFFRTTRTRASIARCVKVGAQRLKQQRKFSRRGGQKTREKAVAAHAQWITAAHDIWKINRFLSSRAVASLLSTRFRAKPRTIRRVIAPHEPPK